MRDPDDFDEFYRVTVTRLTRFAYSFTGDVAAAQDLTQETYARAWQNWERLRGYDNPEAWLRVVAGRLAVSRWRRLRHHALVLTRLGPPPPSPPPSDDVVLRADAYRLAGRVRGYHGGIEAGAYESLTRYASGYAHAFLQQVRDRVAACATFPDPYASPGVQHSLVVAEAFAGDESLVVWTGPSTTPTEYPASFVAVVRVTDFVIVVNHSFDLGASLSLAKTMAAKATNRLTAAVGG